MYKKYSSYSFLLFSVFMLGGCGGSDSNTVDTATVETSASKTTATTDTVSTEKNYVEDSNYTLRINELRLDVHANSFSTTTKLLQDMNSTLGSFVKLSGGATKTIELTSQLLIKLAEPFVFVDDTVPFKLNTSVSAVTAPFEITGTLGNHKYLLISSSSRFFLEKQSFKTLFFDPLTLTNAWKRAVNNRDTGKDLYVTIVSLQSDNTLRNLSNGLLVASDKLQ